MGKWGVTYKKHHRVVVCRKHQRASRACSLWPWWPGLESRRVQALRESCVATVISHNSESRRMTPHLEKSLPENIPHGRSLSARVRSRGLLRWPLFRRGGSTGPNQCETCSPGKQDTNTENELVWLDTQMVSSLRHYFSLEEENHLKLVKTQTHNMPVIFKFWMQAQLGFETATFCLLLKCCTLMVANMSLA